MYFKTSIISLDKEHARVILAICWPPRFNVNVYIKFDRLVLMDNVSQLHLSSMGVKFS